MATVIRIIWFFISMLVFNPAMRSIDSFLFKIIVGFLIFLFLFLIPSNACIAMYRKNSHRGSEYAAELLWAEVKHHVDWSKRYFNYFSLTYYWAAFYYAFLPIFQSRNIDDQLRRDFISRAVSLVSQSESTDPYLLRDFIEHAFDEAMVAYIQDVGNPLCEGAPENIFYVLNNLCDPDEEYDSAKFEAFASSCLRLAESLK